MKKYCNLICFFIGLPIILGCSIFGLIVKSNPLDISFFSFGVIFCLPALIFKFDEASRKAHESLKDEFREMTELEFLEAGEELSTILLNRSSILLRDAYRDVYKERFNRECFF